MEENYKYYHVFNRGIDKKEIFIDNNDFERFLISLIVLNTKNPVGGIFQHNKIYKLNSKDILGRPSRSTKQEEGLVEILSFCLIQNHYHLILREKREKGVSSFMSKLSNAYTKYFNFKYKRSGFLFQGRYKKVEITSDNQLRFLFGYVNGNYQIHTGSKTLKVSQGPSRSLEPYKYSSHSELIGEKKIVTDKEYFDNEFKTKNDFDEFLREVINESSEIKKDRKKYILE
ncbi:MAG: transposase [Thiomicrorhabdus sp.]|jgi:putative transposase|nr:transposase [Thiomicrorhabdus sp.]